MKALYLISLMAALSSASDMSVGMEEGRAAAMEARSFFGGGFTQNVNKPMTSDAEMSTLDGSTTFDNVNLTCADTNSGEFLRVEYALNAGAEITPMVAIDIDLDGSFDATTIDCQDEGGSPIASVRASGVCADGIVSCTSGTWSDCVFFAWDFDGSSVILREEQRSDLGTCQCTNAICGSAAALQKPGVLNLIAEGVFQAVFSGDPAFIISDVYHDETQVSYFGQDNSACNTGVMPTTYTGSLQNKGELSKQQAALDPDSPYSVLQGSTYIAESSTSDKSSSFLNGAYGSQYISSEDASRMDDRQAILRSSTVGQKSGEMHSMSYSDHYVDKDGNLIETTEVASMYEVAIDPVLYCQVTTQKSTSTLFSDGTNASEYASAREMARLDTRECDEDVCPIETGESIKHPCGPISNFPEAAARLEAAYEASKDLICATN